MSESLTPGLDRLIDALDKAQAALAQLTTELAAARDAVAEVRAADTPPAAG